MQGHVVLGASLRPTHNTDALTLQLDQLGRDIEQHWETVGALREERAAAAERELAALRAARSAERRFRRLERRALSADYRASRSCVA